MLNQTVLRRYVVLGVGVAWLLALIPAGAEGPPATAPAGSIARRVVMKDALSAQQFLQRLQELKKTTGLFRRIEPGTDPKSPRYRELSFLTSGNHLLVVGEQQWVDAEVETIRLMAFEFERPRAHLQLNFRVVQLTGPANADVIQMTETVRALVNSQRTEVVRAFGDLESYLLERLERRDEPSRELFDEVRRLLPTLGDGSRTMTVPEILLLLMLDRSSPALPGLESEADPGTAVEAALVELPRVLDRELRTPDTDEVLLAQDIQDELQLWKQAVSAIHEWCRHYARQLDRKDGIAGAGFLEALDHPECPLPPWITLRLRRSLAITERVYPNLVRKHMRESLEEVDRRFQRALERVEKIEQSLARAEPPPADVETTAPAEGDPPVLIRPGHVTRNLLALKSVASELVPAPLALFDAVVAAADDSAPDPEKLVEMLRAYTEARAQVDRRLAARNQLGEAAGSYEELQALEASLNVWLRRSSEAMARALESHFYRRYVEQLRVLANSQLGKSSSRDILSTVAIDQVPDIARDLLLADTGVNIFVSNSVSLQFAPDTTNSVSAQVQARLPSQVPLIDRVREAGEAAGVLNGMSQTFGIDGKSIVQALLAGGQAVPVQAGVNLSATPSIGFDASTVTLTLSARQTLQPNSSRIADRVTNHSIENATVTALSYEPMVLSTLASNVSYYEDAGGIPILRKVPGLKSLLKDIPFKPFKQGRRQKGVYQSSVIILEPVVIPTIEDLVRFHAGWRKKQRLH